MRTPNTHYSLLIEKLLGIVHLKACTWPLPPL